MQRCFVFLNIVFGCDDPTYYLSPAIMPTHPHQVGANHILKSLPACENSYIFTWISALPNISTWRFMNTVFFASQIEIWETAFQKFSHTYPIDKEMSLTFWLMWFSLFLFLWLFFSNDILFFQGIAQCQVQYDKYFTSCYN